MDPSTVTGFLAWLEARPPGATLPRALSRAALAGPPPGCHRTSPPGLAIRDRMNSRSDSRLR